MEGDENPWSGGKAMLVSRLVFLTSVDIKTQGSSDGGASALSGEADRLGWKAMPFARDDLDSNCAQG